MSVIEQTIYRYDSELMKVQIDMITELKNRAIENKDKAPNESYLKGFVKACDFIIDILAERETNIESKKTISSEHKP